MSPNNAAENKVTAEMVELYDEAENRVMRADVTNIIDATATEFAFTAYNTMRTDGRRFISGKASLTVTYAYDDTPTEEPTTYDTDYYRFEIPDEDFGESDTMTFKTATVSATKGEETQVGTAELSTVITATKGTGLFVKITDVPNDVKIKSLTLQ